MNFWWMVLLTMLSSSLASLENEPKDAKKSLKTERFWMGPKDGYQICAKSTKVFHPFDCPYRPDGNAFKRCNPKVIQGISNEKICEEPKHVCCSTYWKQLCCLPRYPNNPENVNNYQEDTNYYPQNNNYYPQNTNYYPQNTNYNP